MMTDNEKKANAAHDELARLLLHCDNVKCPIDIIQRIEKIYDDMLPLFYDILRKE